jgi:hypothetical protein
MITGYKLLFHNVEHKFVDDTKTSVLLISESYNGDRITLGYVHTSDSVEECKKDKEKYLDAILEVIKVNALEG